MYALTFKDTVQGLICVSNLSPSFGIVAVVVVIVVAVVILS